jgi:predicted metal-dependent enzyme (double-stranded beta helix superfamily)
MSFVGFTAVSLSRPDLRAVVADLADDRTWWRDHVRHDPSQRVFSRLLDDPELEAWVICWMPGHDTGFHDHDVSAGAVVVVAGEVREQRLTLGGGVIDRTFGAGETFDFSAADIHRVTHAGSAPAVTLHAYSPRLRRLGAYTSARDGALQRHPLAYGEELRPVSERSA